MILAGGRSSRLGQDKALLWLNGQPMLARTVDRLAGLCAELVVVSNSPLAHGALGLAARLVPDERPGQGSLMGIYSGLKAAQYPYALVVGCDMPLLSLPLLRYMLSLSAGYDVVIPCVEGNLEPLHAVYSRDCLPAMAALLDGGGRRIVDFFGQVRVRYVLQDEIDRFDPQHLSFVNVNTPDDWERVARFFGQ